LERIAKLVRTPAASSRTEEGPFILNQTLGALFLPGDIG